MKKCDHCGQENSGVRGLGFPNIEMQLAWRFATNPFGGPSKDDWEADEDHQFITCLTCFETFAELLDNFYKRPKLSKDT